MKTLHSLLASIAVTIAASLANAPAATVATPEDPAHQELRGIKDDLVTAFNKRDYDGFLRHLHPNIVATWQNSEVARHPDGIKAFMKKMSEGDTKKVESVQATTQVDELTSLYNDKNTGVAFGSVDQDFKFFDGRQFRLTSRWTATFIKENGQWLLAAVHVSGNVFDNPVLELAVKKTALWAGLCAGAVGLLVGFLIARFRKGKAPPNP